MVSSISSILNNLAFEFFSSTSIVFTLGNATIFKDLSIINTFELSLIFKLAIKSDKSLISISTPITPLSFLSSSYKGVAVVIPGFFKVKKT